MSSSQGVDSSQGDARQDDREDVKGRLRSILGRQRRAFLTDGPPDAQTRIDRLDRAIALVKGHQQEIVDALMSDFGHRSPYITRIADIGASVHALRYARRNLRRWMKPVRRKVAFPYNMTGATAWVQYQPLGVVGVISPWNYPFVLTMTPLADVLAAGNRAMIKPSELTPTTSELMKRLFSESFDATEVAVVTGGPVVGEAFSHLQFDHIVFTGSTRVGRMVMRAAAENLVPVTLELGGKSPVVISRKGNLELFTTRIAMAKLSNAGQTCMAPDYVFVPIEHFESFIELFKRAVSQMFPTLRYNPDFTAVVNNAHLERLRAYLNDAESKGARLIEINPAGEDLSDPRTHRLAPTLVLEPTDEMTVMQEEIFGPVLPIKTYRHIDDAIAYINAHPRPLALYYFGHDRIEREHVLANTTSGGVTVNDAMMHYNIPDLPFGGIGPSGMGAYRGVHGFRAFSHAKGVCKIPSVDVPNPVQPPFGAKTDLLVNLLLKS